MTFLVNRKCQKILEPDEVNLAAPRGVGAIVKTSPEAQRTGKGPRMNRHSRSQQPETPEAKQTTWRYVVLSVSSWHCPQGEFSLVLCRSYCCELRAFSKFSCARPSPKKVHNHHIYLERRWVTRHRGTTWCGIAKGASMNSDAKLAV